LNLKRGRKVKDNDCEVGPSALLIYIQGTLKTSVAFKGFLSLYFIPLEPSQSIAITVQPT
jgi:hypothetical protein